MGTRRWAFAAGLALAGGCYSGSSAGPTADADDGAEEGGGSDDGTADGDAGSDDGVPAGCEDAAPPRAALQRMGQRQYVNALEALFGVPTIDAVRTAVDALPATKIGLFSSEVPPASYAEVAAYLDIASRLALVLTADDAGLTALRPCLTEVAPGADAATDACLSEYIGELGPRILRRPLTDEDTARLAEDYAVGGEHNVNEGVATLLIALLIDPEFLYLVETRGEELEEGVVVLTPHETAAKLARVVWNSVPDEELLAVADAGLDDTQLAEQLGRMLDDERARGAMAEFYRDWLHLGGLPFPSEALFPDPDERAELRDAMAEELVDFAAATTLDREGTYSDLLLDREASIESDVLADLYGVSTGSDVMLPEGERAGILTRAGFLATIEIRGSNAGHLIKRGHRLSSMLCRPLPLPDPANFPQDDPADPASNPDSGIRERFNAATTEAVCAACHVQLDSLGAPLGHYGSSGEWIDEETIELSPGDTVALPLNTVSEVAFDGEAIEITDGLAFSAAMAESRIAAGCFAQQLTRNIVARPLEPGDACMVAFASDALAPQEGEPQSIREAIVRLVMSEHFRRNSVQ